jgi:hypothetical protein
MKKNKQIIPQNSFTEFLLYTTPNGKVKVEIFLRNETVWLTQKRMADLFGVGIPAINKHLKNIFESEELQEDSVISILEITADDGKKYSTNFYNLNEQDILTNAGTISREVAEALALGEYEKYRINQDRQMESDFDREVQKLFKNIQKEKIVNLGGTQKAPQESSPDS